MGVVTHLTLGSNAYVSVDRCIRAQVDGLLNADICQGIFSKDGASIKVGGHESTEARKGLVYRTKVREIIKMDLTRASLFQIFP